MIQCAELFFGGFDTFGRNAFALGERRDVTVFFLMPGDVFVERVFDKCEPLS